jgi:hypothetical protein
MGADVVTLLGLTLGALKMGTLPPQYVLKALITKVGRPARSRGGAGARRGPPAAVRAPHARLKPGGAHTARRGLGAVGRRARVAGAAGALRAACRGVRAPRGAARCGCQAGRAATQSKRTAAASSGLGAQTRRGALHTAALPAPRLAGPPPPPSPSHPPSPPPRRWATASSSAPRLSKCRRWGDRGAGGGSRSRGQRLWPSLQHGGGRRPGERRASTPSPRVLLPRRRPPDHQRRARAQRRGPQRGGVRA